MPRKPATPGLLSALIATTGAFLWAVLPRAAAGAPAEAVMLMLPAKATIKTTKGQSYTGVRLSALSPSQITYEKGGKRALSAGEVSSITFLGKVSLKAKGSSPLVRGVEPRGCPASAEEVQVASAALAIQADGTSLALLPAQLPKPVQKDLQQTSKVRTLVVNELRFDPGGKVRVVYKACAPES